MVQERTTVTETPSGETHTHTTVYNDEPRGGAGKWVFLLVLVVIAIGGLIVFNQMGGAEVAKDDAIATAADNVGDAAQKVGDAAEDVVDKVN
jgi:hypothetical protein